VERGHADGEARTCRVWAETLERRHLGTQATVAPCSGSLRLEGLPVPETRGSQSPDRYGRIPALRVFVQTNRETGGWARPLELIVGSTCDDPTPQVLGWTHGARSKHAGPDHGDR